MKSFLFVIFIKTLFICFVVFPTFLKAHITPEIKMIAQIFRHGHRSSLHTFESK